MRLASSATAAVAAAELASSSSLKREKFLRRITVLFTIHTESLGVRAMSGGNIRRLEGKVAIITGAASGIGAATARLFASHGATVVIADIQDSLGLSVATSIGLDKCTYHHCDVTDETQVSATVNYAIKKNFGHLDIMYSNVGIIGIGSSVLDMDMDELDLAMAVNVRGAAAAIKYAGRAMVASGTRGSIICTGSVSARLAGTGPAAYTASKHALVGLMKAAAGELGKNGIRVNSVSPSGVATPLACGFIGMCAEDMEAGCIASSNLKGFVLKAENVGEAVLFLASDESGFVSGVDLVVDGGFTSYRPLGS